MIKAISLFSGAGGMDVGFKNAGVDVVLANEIDLNAANTFVANHPDTKMIVGDINDNLHNFWVIQTLIWYSGAPMPRIFCYRKNGSQR